MVKLNITVFQCMDIFPHPCSVLVKTTLDCLAQQQNMETHKDRGHAVDVLHPSLCLCASVSHCCWIESRIVLGEFPPWCCSSRISTLESDTAARGQDGHGRVSQRLNNDIMSFYVPRRHLPCFKWSQMLLVPGRRCSCSAWEEKPAAEEAVCVCCCGKDSSLLGCGVQGPRGVRGRV